MTIPKHLLLLAAAAVSTVFAVSAQAQFWDEDDESVFRVGEEVFARAIPSVWVATAA